MKRKLNRIIFFSLIALFYGFSLNAQSLEKARELYKAGKFGEAKPIFQELVKRSPSNASLNQWYGACLYETGDYKDAEKYLKFAASRKIQEAYRYLGELYYKEYRFAESLDNYNAYLELQKKQKADVTALEATIAKVGKAAQMVRRVEEVQIIDSLVVDKAGFFRQFRLSPESGSLHDYNTFFGANTKNNSTVYQNQRGDKIVYGAKTARNGYNIMTRSRLIDDTWGEEISLPSPVNTAANENFPFFLSDGTTLYFASDGEESLGGYDLFVTRLNLNTGNYLTPENLGMPFNSPYNDYMMAIDELNNVGWFVSDRFQPEDKLVVYLFIPNAEKKIYRSEDEAYARSLARIDAIRQTWLKGADYKPLLQKIYHTETEKQEVPKADFVFLVNNRITYTSLDNFDSREARDLFLKARDVRKVIRETEDNIALLRKQYAAAKDKKPLESKIRTMEEQLLKLYGQPEDYEARSRAAEINYLVSKQKKK